MRKSVILNILLCLPLLANAQKTPEQLGGVYYAYPEPVPLTVSVPAGYEPFYVSHYGRHGSRWLPDDARYEWVLNQFSDARTLTPLGRSVRKRLTKVWKDARGNGGKLTPIGAQQHRDIAKRMVQRFPQIFTDDTRIWARSSTVDRCRQSMLAFTSQVQQLCPTTPLDVATNPADMAWIVNNTPEVKALEKHTKTSPQIAPDRFLGALFKDPNKAFPGNQTPASATRLLAELFTIATDMQDVGLPVNLFDVFTQEEMQAVYRANNERMTICNGNLPESEGIPARAAVTLWQNIEADADAMIAADNHGAALRFGHDTNLYRLLSLLQVSSVNTPAFPKPDRFDHMDEILPMAANLQMVFYKKTGQVPTDSAVLVLFLHNEQPVTLPIPPVGSSASFTLQEWTNGHAALYTWASVKDYVAHRTHRLDHLRQLCALNTMVGTAQANTLTAGLFGNGSEEHGQTLPAVLTPNGQNFWTPQTQDTEQKCIAPYYYRDSLLQGFRNSHWIVGGCTQDYGSFTVAAITGDLRTTPTARATRFSHDQETSHPHYYAVGLPDEHLCAELTATSHTAMMRITPDPAYTYVHILINPNSDEGQGYISLDTLSHEVYGYNPVHRIYQGWGEPAGFSGHFLLSYPMEQQQPGNAEAPKLIAYGTFSGDSIFPSQTEIRQTPSPDDLTATHHPTLAKPVGIYLTFLVPRGQQLTLTTASSFTSREGCRHNLEAEAAGKTFEQMQAELAERWIDRLHTIDIEDPDTARVTQFYGALYRASFLPREFSDAGGSYFTDFSMWDTYRAVHPLLNIIAPSLSAQMMQSIVTMAEQGGWLPIFPCWNSYTAAMIGDHCSSVLADAYVKGVGRRQDDKTAGSLVDYATAYRYMWKNAFSTPTPEQYRDGMGRRALQSYLSYGYIPMEDPVADAFHTNEQTSRTLEYAYDDFCVAQLARDFGTEADYRELMRRSENWRNVINPHTGWADGRHADGTWENNHDLVHRKSYITEGATCHYTWYVPHAIPSLIEVMGGPLRFEQKLDSMFEQGLYWHGNEPCHQIAYLHNYVGRNDLTQRRVRHILDTEYNDTPGGLSGNDDAGQMSAWYIFSSLGFYPVCPGTPYYQLAAPTFRRATFNLENGRKFTIEKSDAGVSSPSVKEATTLSHFDILRGGTLRF